jgi:hypothetical protein|tara:strand:+ start:197 stop:424 length:228 start_codon:yes stop_codon:yes gene_type:complete
VAIGKERDIFVWQTVICAQKSPYMSVAIRYVKSSENVADMMTKCLPAPAFVKHRDALMGQIDKYWYVQAENDVKE